MAFTKSTVATNNISALPNKPLITATALKQKFDQYGADDKTYTNGLIDQLELTTPGSSGAENIGSAQVSGLAGNTIWAQISALWTVVQNIVIGTLPDNSVTNDKIATASKIGLLADLTTSVKTNIVAAINSISLVLGDGTVTWPKLAPDMQNRELMQDKAITELLMLADIDSKVFSPNLGKFYTNFSATMDYSLGAVDATKQTYTGTLSAGATNVVLPSATGFAAGQEISIQDSTNYEDVIVQSVVSTTVSFKTALVNSYTNPIVYRSNNSGSAFGDISGNSAIGADTKVLLHMDGTNGSTTITDSSNTPKTVTANGNAAISTAQKKFGTGSVYFDGDGDYLSWGIDDDVQFGSGDFTIDGWVNPTDFTVTRGIYFYGNDGNSNAGINMILFNDSGANKLYCFAGTGSAATSVSGGNLTANAWTHVAFVRNSNTLTAYVDGTAVGSASFSSTIAVPSTFPTLSIGRQYGNNNPNSAPFKGYIDEFRISKGVARWTTDFTPPASPYGSGTSTTKNVIRMNITPYEDVKYISAWLTKTDLAGFTADGKLSIVGTSADESYVDLTESITDLGATQEVMMIGNAAAADSKVTLKLELNRASTSDSVSFTKLIGGVSA